MAITLSRSSFKTLLVNAVVASLPVVTYVSVETTLSRGSAQHEGETREALPSADVDEGGNTGEQPALPGEGSGREITLAHPTWLKLDNIETTQRVLRLARPSELVVGGPDCGVPAAADTSERPGTPCLAAPESSPETLLRIVRLAPALRAHAPPLA
jgi:hypothetical protein